MNMPGLRWAARMYFCVCAKLCYGDAGAPGTRSTP